MEDLSGPLAEAEEKIRTLSDELDEYRSGARVSATVSAANEEQLRKQLDEAREQARQDAENAMSEKLELSKAKTPCCPMLPGRVRWLFSPLFVSSTNRLYAASRYIVARDV